jgi:predicted nucleic acid-binding protein
VIVVDASVLGPALSDDSAEGDRYRARLGGVALRAPELIDLELLSIWRRAIRVGTLSPSRAGAALRDLGVVPMYRMRHETLRDRAWELRDNVTPYDAVYVAAAETLRTPLVTADARLAGAPGIRCEVEVLA